MVLKGTQNVFDPIVYEARTLFRCCLAVSLKNEGLPIPEDASDIFPPCELADEDCRQLGQRLCEISEDIQTFRQDTFKQLTEELPENERCCSNTIHKVGKEVFSNDVNWGRIVAFMVYAQRMAIFGRKHGLSTPEDDVTLWFSEVVSTHLVPWIRAQGGWAGILHHYGPSKQTSVLLTPSHFSVAQLAFTVGVVAMVGCVAIELLS